MGRTRPAQTPASARVPTLGPHGPLHLPLAPASASQCLFPNIIIRESPSLPFEALSQQLRRFRPGSVSWQEGASSLCTGGRGVCEGFGRVARSGGRQRTGSTEFLNHWAGASQQGKILSPRGPLTMSGDSFGFHSLQGRDGSGGI